ncbi:MAG: hypothetical protein JWQ35_860, partial [Bacteriovoracaceae bacterium]|nr:hypothetical protein [Bacteriovoracaceae bacterium]
WVFKIHERKDMPSQTKNILISKINFSNTQLFYPLKIEPLHKTKLAELSESTRLSEINFFNQVNVKCSDENVVAVFNAEEFEKLLLDTGRLKTSLEDFIRSMMDKSQLEAPTKCASNVKHLNQR